MKMTDLLSKDSEITRKMQLSITTPLLAKEQEIKTDDRVENLIIYFFSGLTLPRRTERKRIQTLAIVHMFLTDFSLSIFRAVASMNHIPRKLEYQEEIS